MNSTPLVALVFNRRHTATTTKEAAVELRVSYQKEQKYMSTGVRLLPKHWRRGMVINRVDAIQLNQTLEKLVVDVRKVILQMMDDGNIDIFSIPDKLKRLRSGNLTFLDFCDTRMKIRQYGKAVDSQERYTRFMKFFRSWGKIVEFEDITDLNIIALDEYLAARGLKPYSKWNNYHRFLNSFILDAIDEGYVKRNPYKWVRIEKEKSKGGIGKYLSPQEFAKVRDMDLPTESLQRVRDLFVFQTYTCLSYVDLNSFDAENIEKVKGMKVYIGTRAKTSQTFTIPLLKPALAILKKYNNHLPIISNVKYNEYLKVVAQNASIDKPVSSHWARHTGATLLLNSGDVPMNIVQHILGHASQRMTEQVYAKRLDESIVDAMAKIDGKI
jgi:integrase